MFIFDNQQYGQTARRLNKYSSLSLRAGRLEVIFNVYLYILQGNC